MAKKPTILCVDDQEVNLRVRVLMLQQFGCNTLTAHDHTSSIRMATENSIDLALIDYHLENGETGEQVAQDMRVLKPRTPLVMLTGDVRLPDCAIECVDAVLTKGSSSPAELFEIIQRLVPRRRAAPTQSDVDSNASAKAVAYLNENLRAEALV